MFFMEYKLYCFFLTNSLIAKPIPKVVKHTIISITKSFSDKKLINKTEEKVLKFIIFFNSNF